MKFCGHIPSIGHLFSTPLILSFNLFFQSSAYSNILIVEPITLENEITEISKETRAGQIPHSRVAYGNNDVVAAWLTGPTQRYAHGILGDTIEARTLTVENDEGETLEFTLPPTSVFEDLEPRVVDLDGDNQDEIMVIESDTELGASLALFKIESNRVSRVTSTPFIGRANRWLNPVGVGDFDGDGLNDVALVVTPHIGGILQLYKYKDSALTLYTELSGVSNHRIGSTELGLGTVIKGDEKDLIILPDQAHQAFKLLSWNGNKLEETHRVSLSQRLNSSLDRLNGNRWSFSVVGAERYELSVGE